MCIERCKAVRILKQYVFRCPDVWFGQGQPDAGDNFQPRYLGPRHRNIGIPPNQELAQDGSVDM